ncbi:Transposon Ty3-I Gag-Pol polyprotein [Smittium culicis]|uniref:Transposon Ty3-I Gag-Pol polyprotein n=1 Tax=Smittium culicis TaxID=133412 RepID=A0A1R1XTQ2_9FUNG|nr:Transposon Ty3-I Gag-Pol polyprotein [Smittium culicis]
MISDQGSNLISTTVKNFYQYSGIKNTPVTLYVPQANGQVERTIQTLKGTNRKLVKAEFHNWGGYFWKALMNIRTNYHRTIGRTPAELVYGKQLMTPAVWDSGKMMDEKELSLTDRMKDLTLKFPEVMKNAHNRALVFKGYDKARYDQSIRPRIFCVVDQVLHKTEKKKGTFGDLAVGPYSKIRVLGKGRCRLVDPNSHQ